MNDTWIITKIYNDEKKSIKIQEWMFFYEHCYLVRKICTIKRRINKKKEFDQSKIGLTIHKRVVIMCKC
jgi:hypothetical protein